MLLAAALIWAPLPFASVQPWSEALLRVTLFAALALALAGREALAALRPVAVPCLALCGLALLALVQSLPWPAGLVGLLSPRHLELHRAAAVALGGGAEPAALTLSLAPGASRATALSWAAVAAALAAAAVVGRDRRIRRWLLGGLAAGAALQLAYGARRWLFDTTAIWGVEAANSGGRFRGTFVNPNHFATYGEIALAVVFAWGWWVWRRLGAERRRPEQALLLAVPPLLLWLLLAVALVLSGSRAGLAAAATGMAAALALAVTAGGRRGLAPVALVAGVALAGLLGASGLRHLLGRLMATSAFEVTRGGRAQALAASFDLWRDFPWLGSGAGTFLDAFPLVQPAGLGGTWAHAHANPVELLVTAGVVGVALFAVGLWALLRRLGRVLLSGRRSEDRAAALAALAAITGLAVHECFDFGLVVPANAATLAVLLGAAAGAGEESSRG